MASTTASVALSCRVGLHNYAYNDVQYGGVFAVEKVCMNCEKTVLTRPRRSTTR
jgi:hypothetical protein